MTDVIVSDRFACRRRTRANWAANSGEVLYKGELGIESDTGRLKVGDGVSTWASLKYFGLGVVVLVDGASITIDAGLSDNWRVVLGGNRTLANPTNLIDGQTFNIRIKQDGTGGRALAYGSKFKFPGGTAPVLSVAADAGDLLSCQYDATNDTIYAVMNKGFA